MTPWLFLDQWARNNHGVIFQCSSPGGGTSWTVNNQCLVEFITMRPRGEVCYLRLPCFCQFILLPKHILSLTLYFLNLCVNCQRIYCYTLHNLRAVQALMAYTDVINYIPLCFNFNFQFTTDYLTHGQAIPPAWVTTESVFTKFCSAIMTDTYSSLFVHRTGTKSVIYDFHT